MLKHLLMEPRYRHPRTYLVQLERIPDETALVKLRSGILIEGLKTLPAEVILLESDPELPPRPVPIRFRKNVPTSWIQLTLREGRNRQVRKMTAAVGHPTLRLIRTAIGNITLGKLLPGEYRKLSAEEMTMLQDKLQVEEF
jgi:23S rRNA pseudouridine2457 synthase